MSGKILTVPCFVNNMKVRVLCDTGSTLIGVDKALVKPRNYTGEHIICRTFGGEQQKYPVAWVKIHTPYISSRVKCAVLPNPCTELIVGNIPNVVQVDETMLRQWQTDNQSDGDITNAVTRQQTARLNKERTKETVQLTHIPVQQQSRQSTDVSADNSKDQSPQNSNDAKTVHFDMQSLPTLQKHDSSLTKCFDMVNKPDKRTQKRCNQICQIEKCFV